MASGTIGDSNDDLNWRGSCRWTGNRKVYTRKIHKKAKKASINSDTATATTSAAENPTTASASALAENITTARSPTKVSSATVASATTAEVTTANTSKVPKDSLDSSALPTTTGNQADATATHVNVAYDVVQESVEALVTKDAASCQQRVQEESLHQEQSLLHDPADKNVNYSFQEPRLHKHMQHEQHVPSPWDGNGSTQRQVQEGSCSHNAKLRNLEDSSLHNSKESQNLRSSCLPNGREVAAARCRFGNELQNDGELMPVPPQVRIGNGPASTNGVVKPLVISIVHDSVRFKLAKATRKDEIKELRKKLECELDWVRRLVNQLEAKELQLASYNPKISNSNFSNSSNYIGNEVGNIGVRSYPQLQRAGTDLIDRRMLVRVSSGMGVLGRQEIRPMGLVRVNSDVGTARNLELRPYSRQLSVAVIENNHSAGEIVEKEKRTPKANQYYRNSEFLLGKDRLPSESVKRLKPNNGRKHSGETEHGFRLGFGFDKGRAQVFRSCSSLLQRLMKHKHGWVFNEPVNAKVLGLVDYYDIIKQPMDLGTIKNRLSQNWYKSPREFAEDVRLVFRNAMTYNPKGQDVHIMAEQLSQIFEERWATIETEHNPYWKYRMYQDAGLPTPNSRKAHIHFAAASVPVSPPASAADFVHAAVQGHAFIHDSAAALQMRTSDEPETVTPMAVDPKVQRAHVGRIPVQKKPKAKDPNKRDMTYEEKQRLSTNLQSLPAEKLDSIIQIIKKRSTALSQHDDEIEVDIDNVDVETLWELDRFVTNYKKSLSKNKRKAELALQARSAANQTVALMNSTTAAADLRIESGTAFENSTAPPAVESEKQVYNGRSSSSSSSSSDSGSSSSDSDSDSSSEDGSDAGHSPGT